MFAALLRTSRVIAVATTATTCDLERKEWHVMLLKLKINAYKTV
jgi:hypothetical protein